MSQAEASRPPMDPDAIWNLYNETPRGWRDLIELVKDPDVDMVFTDRALSILLSPDIRSLPFQFNQSNHFNYTDYLWLVDRDVNWRELFGKKDGDVSATAHLIDGFLTKLEQEDETVGWRGTRQQRERYVEIIFQILPKISEEETETLFKHLKSKDFIEPHHTPVPLLKLFRDKEISESWKRQAAEIVHDEINTKLSDLELRKEGEMLYISYTWDVLRETVRLEGELPISRDFFQEEVLFLLDQDVNRPLFDFQTLKKVSGIIEDPDMRRQIITQTILETEDRSIRTVDDVKLMKRFLEEFSTEVDGGLRARIFYLLSNAKVRIKGQTIDEKREQLIRNLMRNRH